MRKALPFVLRDFLLISFLFTIIGAYFLVQFGSYFIPYFFWLKLIGFSIVWFAQTYGNNRLYFYFNLGISQVKLLVMTLAIDLLLAFTILLILNGFA